MEWAFAGASRVQQDVKDIILTALSQLQPSRTYQDVRGERIPNIAAIPNEGHGAVTTDESPAHTFTSLTFAESIAAYGSDKPDLRIPNRVSMAICSSAVRS